MRNIYSDYYRGERHVSIHEEMAELGFEPRIEKHSQKHFRLLKVTDRRYIFYRLCGWGHNYASRETQKQKMFFKPDEH